MNAPRIADYEPVEQLGTGNHGQVWTARPPQRLGADAPIVVVKVYNRIVDEAEYGRVADELRVYAAARSPHLVTLYEVGRHGDRLFLAMEHFPKGSLHHGRTAMSAREVVKAIIDAARGAHDLHEAGIVHREIKPANVMLTDGGAKLGDLGLSHVVSPGQTVTGVGVSSVETMEPGIVRGEKATRGSDIWSLGAALHQALTGRSVFGEIPDSSLIAVLRHVMTTPPQLAEAEVRPEHLAIIKRCLDPDRMNRYPTALALAQDLEQAEGLVSA